MSEASEIQTPTLRQTDFYTRENTRKIFDQLTLQVGQACTFARLEEPTPSIEIDPQKVKDIFANLHKMGYQFLDSISAVDLLDFAGPEKDRTKVPWQAIYPAAKISAPESNAENVAENVAAENVAKEDNSARLFMLVYHLFSFEQKQGLVIKAILSDTVVQTIDSIYGNANWLEREIFDLFGIVFDGSRDMRRLMMPEDWVGFPLRRDYQQPDQYAGMSTERPDPIEHLIQYQKQQTEEGLQ